ncbi:DNA-3-methyladenine glycosylase I [Paenibacillus sp. FSL R7-0337]|uniref:DNA-3-methyladenine glycosylase I n=1 Tax=Paenibacillus sp. FSL R7-0337 TaxID=1926588 RepID=UPI00096DE6AD|nr:DNA-3-methyladenine glycosylase I [Paenibacillus sp. FSL R7-0337]OMG00302.1 DNA-3-methyladenine glycosylase [Paenibacillus sp. FSL R7-0337]
MDVKRCDWVNTDPVYIAYHDEEWGKPLVDGLKLFELLMLEGMQAGLSWYTVLKKREGFREAFDGFDPEKIVLYGEDKVEELMQNAGIVRNRLKIKGVIINAQVYQQICREEEGGFAGYLWSFVGGTPVVNHWKNRAEVPATTPQSDQMSKALKRKGMKFVGSTICYAFMQASGMVDDHALDCFCRTPPAAIES